MIAKAYLDFLFEFWPWLSTITVFSVDKFTGFLDWLLADSLFDIRDYVWDSFIVLYIILPALFIVNIYLSILALYLYKRHYGDLLTLVRKENDDPMKKFRNIICYCWSVHARLWHSYEVIGFENVIKLRQQNKGCMIVYYHGAVPIDVYYLNAWSHVNHSIPLRAVVDYFMFHIPGFRVFLDVFGAVTGPRKELENLLRSGEVVIISPGGVREALHSKHYEQIWGFRDGFAKCAINAQVPIIPMFTQNIRQAFDFPTSLKGSTMRRMYEKTRLPISLLFGGFPVKLRTFIGAPIDTKGRTVDQIRVNVQDALENLIDKNQSYRNDWWKGLLSSLRQRFV